MSDGQVGMAGVDVYRGHVHFNLGRDFFQIEAADTAGGEPHAGFEFHRNPFRVLANFDRESFGVDLDPGSSALCIWANLEVGAQLAARAERVLRARNIGMIARTIPLDGNSHAAFTKFVATCLRCAEAERSLASLQIGDAHAGKQHAGKLLWRKSYRNANDRAEDARLAQPVPEGRPFTQPSDFRLAERQRILANLQMTFGLADLC